MISYMTQKLVTIPTTGKQQSMPSTVACNTVGRGRRMISSKEALIVKIMPAFMSLHVFHHRMLQ